MAAQNESVAVDFNTAADQTIVAARAGKKIQVYSYSVVNGVDTAQSIVFKSGSTALSGVMPLPAGAGSGQTLTSSDGNCCLFSTRAGEALVVTTTAATQVSGHLAFKAV